MGFFKKIFKPVRKVLDKVIPNEVKPLLPYAAAFAPMLAPGMFGAGASGLGGLFSQNPIIQRAIMGGALNIGSQLAQEGNEGDINLLSAGLGALSGAMTGNPADYATTSTASGANPMGYKDTMLGGLKSKGMEFLGKGNQIYTKGMENLGLNMDTLKMAALPGSIAMGDSMAAETNLAMRDYEKALAEYNAEQDAMLDIPGKSATFLKAFRAYNIDEDTIQNKMEELGLEYSLRDGGRIGLEFGGIPAAVQAVKDKQLTSNLETAQGMEMPIEDLVQEFIEIKKRKPNNYDELMDFYRQKYGTGSQISSMTEEMTEEFAAKGGIMGKYNMGGSVLPNGIEVDYRGGGFIPMGSKERADDVPARVSKNEFVMTADAVRAAGGGSVNKGAKRMYNLMNNLEARA
jgi:hypothetical protein